MAPATSDEKVLIVPTDDKAKVQYLATEGKRIIRDYGMKCKLDSQGNLQRGGLNDSETRHLISLLRVFTTIDNLTKSTAKDINLQQVLRVVSNQSIAPPYKFRFPSEAQRIAEEAFDRFQAVGWGVDPNLEPMNGPDSARNSPMGVTAAREQEHRLSRAVGKQGSETARSIRYPPPNHSIYGDNGIMRGIVVVRGKPTRYYFGESHLFAIIPGTINAFADERPQFVRRNCKVEGHNGIIVGAWWPQLRCAQRDGAHGASVAGIAGSVEHGADSVVLSGGYDDLDLDRGNTIFYCGSDSHDNTDYETPRISQDTKALQRALELGKSIRVIRSSRGQWEGSPSEGFRYDGLYKVTDQNVRKNMKGGAFIRFTLVRESNQLPIDHSRPTAREVEEFKRVQHYY